MTCWSCFFKNLRPIDELTPSKTSMTMENQPFEDVFPIENGDCPARHISFWGCSSCWAHMDLHTHISGDVSSEWSQFLQGGPPRIAINGFAWDYNPTYRAYYDPIYNWIRGPLCKCWFQTCFVFSPQILDKMIQFNDCANMFHKWVGKQPPTWRVAAHIQWTIFNG